MALNTTPETHEEGERERERGRERDRAVFLSRLCGMTSLCTAAVFVNQGQGCLLDTFSWRKEGRRGKGGGGEAKKRKRRERAETLSSTSRKWVDPDRGRLCSLC